MNLTVRLGLKTEVALRLRDKLQRGFRHLNSSYSKRPHTIKKYTNQIVSFICYLKPKPKISLKKNISNTKPSNNFTGHCTNSQSLLQVINKLRTQKVCHVHHTVRVPACKGG